jgi:hypothetical protein
MHVPRSGPLLILLTILGVAFALYRPLVESNTRYFRHEDDGHHFNRTVEMAKSGDLNPHYFKKPSLHFYLRIPIVLASVAWAQYKHELKSIAEVRTRDPYGLARYAFTASHPTVVRWSRFGSVASTLALIALTFLLAYYFSSSLSVSTVAACITALSPEVVRNAHIVGVDVLMAVLCVACSVLGLWTYRSFSLVRLSLCAVVAGLAGSAKYNAAPIALVPLAVWLLKNGRCFGPSFAIPLLGPLIGLLAGSPYILTSFSEFWQDLSFEIRHYGVEGHEGHSAERGLPQAIFYGSWLLWDGIGVLPTLFALLGFASIIKRKHAPSLIILSFPVAYAGLMIMQKANFTRNMIALVPYVAFLAALGVQLATSYIRNIRYRQITYLVLSLLSLVQIGNLSLQTVSAAVNHHDSRDSLARWLEQQQLRDYEIAVAGPLQIPFYLFSLPGVDSFDPKQTSAAQLVQGGYSYIVAPSASTYTNELLRTLSQELAIDGETAYQRVPDNPAITILRVSNENVLKLALDAKATIALQATHSRLKPLCPQSKEPYCWLSNLVTEVELLGVSPLDSLSIEAMSPWSSQTLSVVNSKDETLATLRFENPGNWEKLEQPLPAPLSASELPLRLRVDKISSPASRGMSSDARRLGVALR